MRTRLLVGMASAILLATTAAVAQNAPAPATPKAPAKKVIVEDTRIDRKTGKVIEKTITVPVPVGPEDRWFPGMRKGDPPSRLDTLAKDCTCCKECRAKIVEELKELRERVRILELPRWSNPGTPSSRVRNPHPLLDVNQNWNQNQSQQQRSPVRDNQGRPINSNQNSNAVSSSSPGQAPSRTKQGLNFDPR